MREAGNNAIAEYRAALSGLPVKQVCYHRSHGHAPGTYEVGCPSRCHADDITTSIAIVMQDCP